MTESDAKYKMVPVVDKKTGKIPHLYTRNGTYYVVAQVNGKRFLRACPFSTLKEARKWVKQFIRDERANRGQVNEQSKARNTFATVGQIIEIYKTVAKRRGHPSDATVRGNVQAMRKIITRGSGTTKPDTMRSNRALTAEVVKQFADGELAKCNTEMEKDSKRRTIATALRCARSIFAKKMMQEYSGLQLPDLTGFCERWVVQARVKRYRLPADWEIDPVLEAGRKLGDGLDQLPVVEAERMNLNRKIEDFNQQRMLAGQDMALQKKLAGKLAAVKTRRQQVAKSLKVLSKQRDRYAVFCCAYYLGMRAGEIAGARWSWIHKNDQGVTVMDLTNKPEEGFRAKGREGNVPIHEEVLAEILKVRRQGADYILLGPSTSARLDFVKRNFSTWMKELGWNRTEAAHELRKLRGHKWKQTYGIDTAHDWLRHATMQTTIDYYSDNKNQRAPIGLD